jgi:hydroxylamine dehydrogenase
MHNFKKLNISIIVVMVLFVGVSVAATKDAAKAAPLKTGQISSSCIQCHSKTTPGVVADWKASQHSKKGISCQTCHGTAHNNASDAEKANVAGPETCKQCHGSQVTQFMAGKHAMAHTSGFAIPSFHNLPGEMVEGGKGCGGCHKFGPTNPEQFAKLKRGGLGTQSSTCDACHTRHTFSKTEASQPQACMTCHQGPDHETYQMYASSKHGVRSAMKQMGALPKDASAPTCQTCHMSGGNHAVKTAWGLFGVRAPLSDDPKWQADQVTILQALGALDLTGKPTALFDALKSIDAFRSTKEDWQKERDKMITTCSQCHTTTFAKTELEKSDRLIRESDVLLAEAIRVVADLYKDGIVEKPEGYAAAYPQLLTWKHAPNAAEDKLFTMFLHHRPNMFLGAFHNNPAVAANNGFGAMKDDLNQIKGIAADLRREKRQQAELQKSH